MFTEPYLNTSGLVEFSKVMQTLDCILGLHSCLVVSEPPCV